MADFVKVARTTEI